MSKTSLVSKNLLGEFLPAKRQMPEGKEKLLIVLHGLGDSIEGFRFLPDLLQFDSLSYLLVNAPDSYFTGYSWFDLHQSPAPGIIRSRKFLFELLQDLHGKSWKPEQIALFGFSQGCVMAMDIACRYPQTLGAIVGVSGFVYFMEQYPESLSKAAKTQNVLFTHGKFDPVVPFEEGKRQVSQLKGMGMNITWKEYNKEHTIDPREEMPQIRKFLASWVEK